MKRKTFIASLLAIPAGIKGAMVIKEKYDPFKCIKIEVNRKEWESLNLEPSKPMICGLSPEQLNAPEPPKCGIEKEIEVEFNRRAEDAFDEFLSYGRKPNL